MEPSQSIANRENPIDEELAYLERKARRWELKYHLLLKGLMSPTVAAAIIGVCGAILTGYLANQNAALQTENALIIETLKAEPTKAVSQLNTLVDAGLLPVFGKALQQKLAAAKSNTTAAPPN
jgi:hypothetical protein